MSDEEPTAAELRTMDKKRIRKEYPSGWMEVARYETVVLALDALLEAPAVRQFTIKELAAQAGTSEKSLRNRIGSLVRLNIVTRVDRDDETLYTLNDENPIVNDLYELNVTVQRVREGTASTETGTSETNVVDESNRNRSTESTREPESKFTVPN